MNKETDSTEAIGIPEIIRTAKGFSCEQCSMDRPHPAAECLAPAFLDRELTTLLTKYRNNIISECEGAIARSGITISGLTKTGKHTIEIEFVEPLPDVIAFIDDEKLRAALRALKNNN